MTNLYKVNRLDGTVVYVLAQTLSEVANLVHDSRMCQLIATEEVRADIPNLMRGYK